MPLLVGVFALLLALLLLMLLRLLLLLLLLLLLWLLRWLWRGLPWEEWSDSTDATELRVKWESFMDMRRGSCGRTRLGGGWPPSPSSLRCTGLPLLPIPPLPHTLLPLPAPLPSPVPPPFPQPPGRAPLCALPSSFMCTSPWPLLLLVLLLLLLLLGLRLERGVWCATGSGGDPSGLSLLGLS